MNYSVIKPFHSVQQRFRVGDKIAAAVDLSPLSISSALEAGLIEEADEDNQDDARADASA